MVITHVLCVLIRRGSRNPQLKHGLYDNRGLHLLPSALSPDAKWPGTVPRREALGRRVSGGCGLCFQQQNWAHFCSERSDTFGDLETFHWFLVSVVRAWEEPSHRGQNGLEWVRRHASCPCGKWKWSRQEPSLA